MKESEIKIKISLDDNKVPEQIHWTAEDAGELDQKSEADLISLWPEWHNKAAILFGESKSGKSHLGSIWMKKSNAKLIDLKKSLYKSDIQKNSNYLIDNFS